MSLPVERLVRPLAAFYQYVNEQQERFHRYKSFKPLMDYMERVLASLEEGIGWLQQHDEDELSYKELQESLTDDTAEGLQEALDSFPRLVRLIPKGTPEDIEGLLNDVQSFVEDVCEDISKRGYDLYHVLIGAA
jgi:hypothetical protein